MAKVMRKTVILFCVFLLILPSLYMFTSGIIQNIRAKQPVKVACVGDSLTYGYLSSSQEEKAYPVRMQKLLGEGYEVNNFGVNGTTMLQGFKESYVEQEEYKQSLKYNPDIVIIMLGTNDSKPMYWNCNGNEKGVKYIQDAEKLVEAYQNLSSNPRIIFAISPVCLTNEEGTENIKGITISEEIVPIQRQLAKKNGWDTIDMHELTEEKQELYHQDGIHFNDTGYYYEAVCMYEAITGEPFVPTNTLMVKNADIQSNEPEKNTMIFELEKKSVVNGIYYLPPQEESAIITEYEIQISEDGGITYRTVAQGTWEQNSDWKYARFTSALATHIKFVVKESVEGSLENSLAAALKVEWIGRGKVDSLPFEDVYDDSYYREAILWAYNEAIVEGKNEEEFVPYEVSTRCDVVTMMWRAAKCPEPKTKVSLFEDVSEDAYYYKAVLWAVENGITEGMKPDKFAPHEECTRGQVVTFLRRAAGQPVSTGNTNIFEDVSEESYYYDAVLWAVENNITNGTNEKTFEPDSTCTRGEIITFLYRYYNNEI